jgi:hypothetical protein
MKTALFAVALPLLLAGCASPGPLPEVMPYKSAVASGAKAPKTHHHSTLTGYSHREPVAPDAWGKEDATKKDCDNMEGTSDDCPAQ